MLPNIQAKPLWRRFYLLIALAAITGMLTVACSSWAPEPTMEDLLDGRMANDERLAAVDRVLAWADRAALPDGIRKVGTQVLTFCQEGQDNFKVHDSYKIYCQAEARVFLAWSGDFNLGRATIEQALGSGCSGPSGHIQTEPPERRLDTAGGSWSCPAGLSFSLNYGDLRGRGADDSLTSDLCASVTNIRCISGPPIEVVLDRLAGYQWLAVQLVDLDYYRVPA